MYAPNGRAISRMSKTKKCLAYVTFIIATLIFLAYYLFPSESVKRYIIFKTGQIHPDIELSIGHVFPTFSLGLGFQTVVLKYSGYLVLDAEEIRVVPRLSSLFSPKRSIRFSLKAPEGSLTGRLDFSAHTGNQQLDIEATISGMQMAFLPAINNHTTFKVSGVLRSEIRFKITDGIKSALHVNVKASNFELQPLNPLLLQDRFKFKQIEAALNVSDRRIEIESCNFTGDQIDGKLSGFGVLKNPVNKSIIEMSATFNPHHLSIENLAGDFYTAIFNQIKSENGVISISIKGPIENLAFYFH